MEKDIKVDLGQALFEELNRVYKATEGRPLPPAKKYKKGDCLYQEGQVPKGIYYVRSGSVKVTHDSHKKPVTVRCALSSDFVGYLSLIKQWDYVTTATAIEDSEAYFIPKHVFLKVIHSDNKFTNILMEVLCNRITEIDKELLLMLTKEVSQRLALLLLSLNHCKLHEPGHVDGIINIPKKDLASILNINPETLSRNLSKLSKEKAIRLHNKKSIIEISSKQKLLQLSNIDD